MTAPEIHPLIAAAARGRLPDWAVVKKSRRPHLESVAGLLSRWAAELELSEPDRVRWAAAGWLHDALRDADAGELAEEAAGYPEKVRHGPAVAVRLERAGVNDAELSDALRFHSLGNRGLGRLGRFLYVADYLDAERSFDAEARDALRARLPAELEEVLKTVCARRIGYLLDRRIPIRRETVAFWNELLGGE